MAVSWKECLDSKFPVGEYDKEVPDRADVTIIYASYFRGTTGIAGIHLWARCTTTGANYWYMVPYQKHACYQLVQELAPGDRVTLIAHRTRNGRKFVRDATKL